MSSNLDCKFYTSFYEDLSSLADSTDLKINEHYLMIGKIQGRAANKKELDDMIASIVRFDYDVYKNTNLSYELDKTLNNTFLNLDCMEHYYNETTGNLYKCNRFRILNNNDIKIVLNEWEGIYKKIFDLVDFDLFFYKSFYEIPASITTLQDLKIHWLKNGLFSGQKPNLKSLNENINIIGNIQSLLIKEFNLDMTYLSSYKSIMMDYAVKHNIVVPSSLDETNVLLYLFFNTGYQLRLFFSQNEYDVYKSERIQQYNSAVVAIKSLNQKLALDMAVKSYALQDLKLSKVKSVEVIPIIKEAFSNIISLSNIIKLSNEDFLNCFKKIYNVQDLMVAIKLIVSHELTNYLSPELNSMEVKILVTSLVYNTYIQDKVDSEIYASFVKDKSIEILTLLFKDAGLTDFETVLAQDVAFVIDNKKVIKLSYLKNKALSVLSHMLFF